jgi:hypothetical protein
MMGLSVFVPSFVPSQPSCHHNVMLNLERKRRNFSERSHTSNTSLMTGPHHHHHAPSLTRRIPRFDITRSTMSSQPISVPHGPDRQRILNVLAQRRYRKQPILITFHLVLILFRSAKERAIAISGDEASRQIGQYECNVCLWWGITTSVPNAAFALGARQPWRAQRLS